VEVRQLRDGGSQGAGSIAESRRPGIGKPVSHRVACAQDPQEVQKNQGNAATRPWDTVAPARAP
jgi:hypothetical protein